MLLTLQATSMGIYTHLMGGYDPKTIEEYYHLQEDIVPFVVIALGYLDDPEKLIEPYRTREVTARVRRPIEETVLFRQ